MRIQSFEFGDIKEVPQFYHNYLRALMSLLYEYLHIHRLWLPMIRKFSQQNKGETLLDPCAGSGHVNLLIAKELEKEEDFKFYLSDFMTDRAPKFAKQINEANHPNIHYIEHSVDLLQMKDEVEFPKVFINSFHHFSPDQVAKIFRDHARVKKDILILEYCRKTPLNFFSMVTGPFIGMLLFPLIVEKKDILWSFIFVFIIPLIPLMLLWDGVISSLRTYSRMDIEKILLQEGIKDFKVEFKSARSLQYPSGVTGHLINFSK